jgi:hypothetical protein
VVVLTLTLSGTAGATMFYQHSTSQIDRQNTAQE